MNRKTKSILLFTLFCTLVGLSACRDEVTESPEPFDRNIDGVAVSSLPSPSTETPPDVDSRPAARGSAAVPDARRPFAGADPGSFTPGLRDPNRP